MFPLYLRLQKLEPLVYHSSTVFSPGPSSFLLFRLNTLVTVSTNERRRCAVTDFMVHMLVLRSGLWSLSGLRSYHAWKTYHLVGYPSVAPPPSRSPTSFLDTIISIILMPLKNNAHSDFQLRQYHTMCGVLCRLALRVVYASIGSTAASRLYVLMVSFSRLDYDIGVLWILKVDAIFSSCITLAAVCSPQLYIINLMSARSENPMPMTSNQETARHSLNQTHALFMVKMALCSSIATFPYLQPTKCQGSA